MSNYKSFVPLIVAILCNHLPYWICPICIHYIWIHIYICTYLCLDYWSNMYPMLSRNCGGFGFRDALLCWSENHGSEFFDVLLTGQLPWVRFSWRTLVLVLKPWVGVFWRPADRSTEVGVFTTHYRAGPKTLGRSFLTSCGQVKNSLSSSGNSGRFICGIPIRPCTYIGFRTTDPFYAWPIYQHHLTKYCNVRWSRDRRIINGNTSSQV